MHIRIINMTERNILNYIRARTHNDTWILDKRISIFTFHNVSEVSSGPIISPVCWMPDVFPLKCDNEHFTTSTADIWKSRMLSHNPYHPPPPTPTIAPEIVLLFHVVVTVDVPLAL